jgi:DNA-binding NtrC family response regulator
LPIHEKVSANEFRQDLLYRINTVEIQIPALRERSEDISLLVEHFLKIYSKKYHKSQKRMNAGTVKKLEKYHWPGNVRELQHAIERAIIMSETTVLQPTDFFFPSQESKDEGLVFDTYNLEEVEKATIRRVLSRHGGNISQASKELGLSRTSLYRRLEKYGL